MKPRDGLIFMLVLGLSCVVYWLRMPGNPPLVRTEDGLTLNAKSFDRDILKRFPQTGRSRVNLIVFLDPWRDCPVCIGEIHEWLRHMGHPEFSVTLFITKPENEARLEAFLNEAAIEREWVVLTAADDDLAVYHRFGVFKVFHHAERGVIGWEGGSRSDTEYRAFRERMRRTLSDP